MPKTDRPYLNNSGSIIIPFSSDPKYHYWKGGQHLTETMVELNATKDIWDKHTEKKYLGNVV